MITEQLQEAVKGLLYISETESPWDVVSYNRVTLDCGTVRRMGRHGNLTPCEQIDFDAFFETQYLGSQADQYRKLYNIMATNLSNMAVFKIHTGTKVDVYVLGIEGGLRIVGVHASGVET